MSLNRPSAWARMSVVVGGADVPAAVERVGHVEVVGPEVDHHLVQLAGAPHLPGQGGPAELGHGLAVVRLERGPDLRGGHADGRVGGEDLVDERVGDPGRVELALKPGVDAHLPGRHDVDQGRTERGAPEQVQLGVAVERRGPGGVASAAIRAAAAGESARPAAPSPSTVLGRPAWTAGAERLVMSVAAVPAPVATTTPVPMPSSSRRRLTGRSASTPSAAGAA